MDDNSTNAGKLGQWDYVWAPEDPTKSLWERVKKSEKGQKSLRCRMMASEEEKILEYVNETGVSDTFSEPWQQNWKGSWYDCSGEVHCDPWSFKKGDSYTVVAMNGIDPRYEWTHDQSDFFTMMQHGIFFLAYETAGPDLGPTMEIFGDFHTDGHNEVKIKWSYVPEALSNGTDFFFGNKKRQRLYEEVLEEYLNDQMNSSITVMRDDPPWQL